MPDSNVRARRNNLPKIEQPQACDHPGLLLHRYLSRHGKACTEALLESAAASKASQAYQEAYQRWHRLEPPAPAERVRVLATLDSPMAIGVDSESPFEVGITTHHTYGMPVIPGSAVKGLCSHAAEHLKMADPVTFHALFGAPESAACFTWWDAWYDPTSADRAPLYRDTITVHHPRYYGGQGAAPPSDFDDPTPVPFVVVKAGARFLFTVDAPQAWRGYVGAFLKWALQNAASGAKSNAGYGRWSDVTIDEPGGAGQPTAVPIPADSATEEWHGVTLRYIPQHGVLEASRGGLRATAPQDERDRLLTAMTDAQRERLLSKKGPRRLENVRVIVQRDGRMLRIIGVSAGG